MGQPHALGDHVTDVHHTAKLATSSNQAELLQTICQLEAVERRPADDKHGHQGDDEPERLALLAAGGVAEGPEDADVAVEHDQQGEHETQNHADELQPHQPLSGVLSKPHLAHARRMTVYGVRLHHLFERDVHHAQAQAAHPDDGARNLRMAGVALPAGADGVDNGQVPVEADAGQEEDPTVAVQGEEGAGKLAHSHAEHPLVGPLHSKQGQSEGQQEVRDGQVEEEGVRQGEGAGPSALRVSVASDHAEHQHVAHDSQDEHQAVHNRRVGLCKAVDVLLCARFRMNLAGAIGEGVIVIVFLIILLTRREMGYFKKQQLYFTAFTDSNVETTVLFKSSQSSDRADLRQEDVLLMFYFIRSQLSKSKHRK